MKRDLFALGGVMFFLGIMILALGLCTPACSTSSSYLLVFTFFGGIIVMGFSILWAIYRRLRPLAYDSSQIHAPPVGGRKISRNRKLGTLALAAMIVGLAAYAVVQISNRPEWVFNGAFADYEGTSRLRTSDTYTYNLRILIISYNSSQALVNINSKMIFQPPSTNFQSNTTSWVAVENTSSNPFIVGSWERNYSTTVILENKSVFVTAFAYPVSALRSLAGIGNFSNVIVLDSHCEPFPVEFVFNLISGGNITVILTKTNIPGLLPSLPLSIQFSNCPQ